MKKTVLLYLALLIAILGKAQDRTITGIVLDSNKEPIIGVSVVEKGTTNGTVTDIDGKYRLKLTASSDMLMFSFLGMETQEVALGGRNSVNITMSAASAEMDEVIVYGYGSGKKASVVGSIATIGAEEVVQSPTANLATGLAGKLTGVTILVRDGELGKENVQTYIRGQATLNGSSPLILVDGVEREITTLDPNDVESISVLKDASATAVFGVRGANGVIIVTTKKGVIGKPKLSLTTNYSLQSPTALPSPLGAIDYMNLRNDIAHQENVAEENLPFGKDVFEHYEKGDLPHYYVDRNWYDEFLQDYVPMQKVNLNMRGGNAKTKYFTSVGYMRQGGPFKTERWDEYNYDNEQRLDRFTYRANIDMKLNKTLKGWLNISGYLQDKNDPIIYGAVANAASTASYYFLALAQYADIPSFMFPDLTPDGNVVANTETTRTPYGSLNRTGYRVTTRNSLNTTLGFEQDLKRITEGLSLKTVISYDNRVTHIRGFRRDYDRFVAQLGTSPTTGNDTVTYLNGGGGTQLKPLLTQSLGSYYDLNISLNYKKNIGKHSVKGLLLATQSQRTKGSDVPSNYQGLVGRVVYSYDRWLLSEVNFGMNGSEQFGGGNRFGFFPSLSLGWVMSEMSFIKNINTIRYLKIRGSLGTVGNDNIGNRRFLHVQDWVQRKKDYFDGTNVATDLGNPTYEATLPNPLVQWEVARKANIGIDSRFIRGFEFDFDFFYEKRDNILIDDHPVPQLMFGQLNLPPVNDGVMINRGFEAVLSKHSKVGKDLHITTKFTGSFARNKIIKQNEVPFDTSYTYPNRKEGFSRGTRWGYDCAGYFTSAEEIAGWASYENIADTVRPGDLKYIDHSGDGVIGQEDKIPMKYPSIPELELTFSLNLNYKGLDFLVLLQSHGNYNFNQQGRAVYDWSGSPYNGYRNYFEHHKYAWTEERFANGDKIIYPRMYLDGTSPSKQPSNYWMQDIWYLRIRNLELGYTLPKTLTERIKLDNVRIYVNGLNIWTWHNLRYDGFDPEVPNSLSHPIYSTYNLGLNVTF